MQRLKEIDDVLHPFGDLDLLYYYSPVARELQGFLKGRELATKIRLPGKLPTVVRRGSQLQPLYIKDLLKVDESFLRLRVGNHLKDMKSQLTYKQILLWEYFFPRKMMDFLYACNHERSGNQIERIFIDIDRGSQVSAEDARIVTLHLSKVIREDLAFNRLVTYKPFFLWTGASFHLYLMLKRPLPGDFYEQYFSYNPEHGESHHLSHHHNFTLHSWAKKVTQNTGIYVDAGHEKLEDSVVLDASGTPSGKLARVPFSLHVVDSQVYDGITVPISERQLRKKGVTKELQKLTPELVLKNLKKYVRLLVE